jgi:hypothetical protein
MLVNFWSAVSTRQDWTGLRHVQASQSRPTSHSSSKQSAALCGVENEPVDYAQPLKAPAYPACVRVESLANQAPD